MNREQMIAWLTLEGWVPIILSDYHYAVNKDSGRYATAFDTTSSVLHKYHPDHHAAISSSPNVGWGSWGDHQIKHLMEAATK